MRTRQERHVNHMKIWKNAQPPGSFSAAASARRVSSADERTSRPADLQMDLQIPDAASRARDRNRLTPIVVVRRTCGAHLAGMAKGK